MAEFTDSEKQLMERIAKSRLRDSLTLIRNAVEDIWADDAPRIIQDYTDHGIHHSERLADYAVQLLAVNAGRPLSAEETYLLLAGICLHDVGMQCDVVKYPEIKARAEAIGARFDVEFTARTASSYTIDEQKAIRNNHHLLTSAWIDHARRSGKTVLGPAIRTVPDDLVGDLISVCKYHAKLGITECPATFTLNEQGRRQLVAALVRFADELDMDGHRVSIETVKSFRLDPRNAAYWWLHQLTKVIIAGNVIILTTRLRPDDEQKCGSLIREVFIQKFQAKNRPVLGVLRRNNIPIAISADSGVIPYEYADPLPDYIVQAFQSIWEKKGMLDAVSDEIKNVLVVGAADAGAMIVREMRANPGLGLLPVGFVDDDVTKLGMRIYGVPVLGTRKDISDLVARHDIEEVIIAMPTAPGRVIREFKAICERAGVGYKTIPGVYELLDGSVSVSQIRDVQLEDLLRREPIAIDLEEVGVFLTDARVLVTGAGGSIGSELCRQIAQYGPERLILLDHGETSIFYIHRELVIRFPDLAIVPVICDIRDEGKTEQIIRRHKPTVVFHSAAYKHVLLMEVNVDEAVTNNIIGTQNLIRASERHSVRRFVLISTDKAVNPRSVMGASKRVEEMLVQDMARRSGEAFVAVRFGNTLGSSGSVIPIFRDQIAGGGPVTITDPEARRYFMTIPEAVQLVIQAAAMGKGREIFVLDMGKPIKIVDLATRLIELSGLKPGRDIDIVYTGLRPGEKLCEELLREGERVRATKHEQILIAEADDFDGESLRQGVLELERLARQMDGKGTKRKLRELVPEYELADS